MPWADVSLDGVDARAPDAQGRARTSGCGCSRIACCTWVSAPVSAATSVLDFQPATAARDAARVSWEPGRCVRGGRGRRDPESAGPQRFAGRTVQRRRGRDRRRRAARGRRCPTSRPVRSRVGPGVELVRVVLPAAGRAGVVDDGRGGRGAGTRAGTSRSRRCRRPSAEIYVNPLAGLTEAGMAVRAGARDAARRAAPRRPGRRPGSVPVERRRGLRDQRLAGRDGRRRAADGVLHDPELRGLSAESVYDRIAVDLRRYRKLLTLRGDRQGDLLGEPLPKAGQSRGRDRPGRLLPAGAADRAQLSHVVSADCCPRAGRGDPGAGAPAAVVGRPAGAVVRGVRSGAWRSGAATRARHAARRRLRTFRGRAGCGRRRWSRGRRSASCWTRPARWTPSCWARRSARSRRTRRHVTCPPRAWFSVTRWHTTLATCRSRTSRAG